jgi:hypothetical protein
MYHVFFNRAKMTQNVSKPWAIVHAFWPKMPENTCFFRNKNNLKGVKMNKIHQNHVL